MRLHRGSISARAIMDRAVQNVPDIEALTEYTLGEYARAAGFRSTLAVPMFREGVAIGVIVVARPQVGPFSEREVELLKTFASQAVIAIENVRLFKELEEKNRSLTQAHAQVTETLEQQTATSEILRVISLSPTDVQPVFDAVAESAARLCEAFDSSIWRRDGDWFNIVAHHGPILQDISLPVIRGTGAGRAVLDGRTIHVNDMQTEEAEFPESCELARRLGFRTLLCVPLIREGVALGVITLRRTEVRLFTDRPLALLHTFPDHSVLALHHLP